MTDLLAAEPARCAWVNRNPRMIAYHDQEWGVPQHDDTVLFEFLVLEGAQAGLSWETVLNKRENFRQAFAGFDPQAVANFGPDDLARLLADPGIIRNRLKLNSAVENARLFLKVQAEFGTFDRYLWQFADTSLGQPRPIENQWAHWQDVPARTAQSDALSRDLGKRGFKFVGSVICYSYMQAVGLINDHSLNCFRHP